MSDKIIRILLIEDNPDDARVIRQMLADTATADSIAPAFDLTRARRLSSGLRRLAAERFDALLLDLSLPDSQGLDTLVKAQTQTPQTPIIVLGDLDEELALEAMQKGAEDYLVKGEANASKLVRTIRYATERKRLEAMLGDRQAELAATVENAPLVMLLVDQDMLVQKVNRAAIRFAGHSAEEMIGRCGGEALRCLHNLDDPRGCGFGPFCKTCTIRCTVTDTIEKGIRHTHVQAGLTVVKEGETKDLTLLISTAPLTVAEKPMVLLYIEDITERKRAEEALRDSEERYRRVFENSPVSIWEEDFSGVKRLFDDLEVEGVTDIETYFAEHPETVQQCTDLTKIVDVNRAALALHAAANKGELLAGLVDVFTLESFDTFQHELVSLWNGETEVSRDAVIKTLAGEPRNVTVYVSVCPGYEETLSKVLVSLTDITERKRAEETLRASEEQLQLALDAAQMGQWDWNIVTGEVMWSQQCLALYGLPPDTPMSYDRFLQALHPEDRGRVDTALRRAVEDRTSYDESKRTVWPDGSVHWTASRGQVYCDATGQPIQMTGVTFDITEWKEAQEAVQESETRYRAVVEAFDGLIYICSQDYRVEFMNKQLLKRTGYDGTGELCYKVLHGLDSICPWCVNDRVFAGETVHWEIQSPKDNRWYYVVNTPIYHTDGSMSKQAMILDITERRQAEEEREHLLAQVQEQARRVQEIMDTVPEGVLLLDATCRVLLANPSGKRDLATLADAQVGDILTRLGDRSLAELLTSPPKGLWHEVAMASRFFQAIARPIENDPTPKGWVLVIRDVTQQREVERRVQQQERLAALGQLAAGIAHDFNNILAVISLYAGMSLRIADLPTKVGERLEIVDQQARRASALVQQVLDFSRRAVLERGAMDLLTFLKEQIKLLKRMLPESIEVKLVYDEGEYTVNADPTRMQQAIMNLATNARDAMPQGGRLSFGLERIHVRDRASAPLPDMEAGDWVCVTITDTGAGIPPDVLPHIFEPFFTTKAVGRGTGLGLAQVYGIIEQHEGVIDVKAEIGAGTTFLLYLPALVVPQPPLSPSRIEQLPQGHGETVLVVEDDTVARQAVVSGLETLGYQALQATNGLEALDVFEQHADKIELVLSDVVMPEMDGRSLLYALRQRDPAMRVVLLTGYPLKDKEFEDLRTLGLREWALKPLNIEQLAHITAQALGDVEHK